MSRPAALSLALSLALAGASPGLAQETPADPAPAAAPAPVLQPYQRVEVEDPVDKGFWDPCTVITVFQGAYELNCSAGRVIRRDIHVRPIGGQPPAQTAARAVTAEPWPRGALVLVTTMGLPDDWQLCVVQKNEVAINNSYVVACAGSEYRALPKWIRADPDAPPSA